MTRARVLALAAACLAALALSAGAAQATDVQIDISPAGEFSAAGTLTFASDNDTITCPVTLAGTLAATSTGEVSIGHRPGVNPAIGALQSIRWGTCSPVGASVAFLEELPQDLTYIGQTAETPEAMIYVEGTRFKLEDPLAGIECRFGNHLGERNLSGRRGAVTTAAPRPLPARLRRR